MVLGEGSAWESPRAGTQTVHPCHKGGCICVEQQYARNSSKKKS